MKLNLPLLAAAVTGMQVGAAIVASRAVVGEVPPLTLAMLRYAIGFCCLLPWVMMGFRRRALESPAPLMTRLLAKDMVAMALLGILQFAAVIALLNFGLQRLGAAPAALIFSLFPLLTLLFSAALGQERITPALLGGVALSILGVAASLLPRMGVSHTSDWWGEGAVLASAAVGAACSVLYRPYLRRYPTLPVSAYAMLASVGALAVLALAENWPTLVTALSPRTWGAVGFIGLSSGVGYFLWLFALKYEAATRVTVFLALSPITAALLGGLLLGEPLGLTSWLAMALIGTGLWLATRAAMPALG